MSLLWFFLTLFLPHSFSLLLFCGDIFTFLLFSSLTPSFLPHLLFCTDSLSDSKRGMQVLVCSLPSVCVISVWASVLWSKRVMFVFLCTDTARTVWPCVCVCVCVREQLTLWNCACVSLSLNHYTVFMCLSVNVTLALSNRGVISCFYSTVSPSPLIWLAGSCSKLDIKDLRRKQT